MELLKVIKVMGRFTDVFFKQFLITFGCSQMHILKLKLQRIESQ